MAETPGQAAATDLLALAKQHHQGGRLGEAREAYQQVLALEPRSIEALFLLAVIVQQEGRMEAATDLLRKAVEVQPAFPRAWRMLANIQAGRGDVNGAMACHRQGLGFSPGDIELESDLANLLLGAGRLDEAIVLYRKVLERAPEQAVVQNNLGIALDQRGLLAQSLEAFGRALALRPDYAEAHYNRANALAKIGRHGEAFDAYRRAIQVKPDFAQAFAGLGQFLAALGRTAEAIEAYRKVIELQPRSIAIHVTLGNTLASVGRHAEAIGAYRKAIELKPDYAEMYSNLGFCLVSVGQPDEAVKSFRRALELNPSLEGAYNGLGLAYTILGDNAEARSALEKAIALSPGTAHYYYNLSDLVRFSVGSPELNALVELDRQGTLAPDDRKPLHFALAKAYDDVGQYDDAWRHLEAGNTLHRRSLRYDPAVELSLFDRIRRQFSGDFIRAHEGHGHPSSLPIFIVGMPRSGTTLLEQILSSHPEVFGAGELLDFRMSVEELDAARGAFGSYPESVASLDAMGYAAIGTRYLEKVRRRAPEARRITDKLPQNFLWAGLIHLALPNAPIIHIVRDAADTCLSNYFRLFQNGHEYSYDLVELARYHRRYQALMLHWHGVLPPGRILDVRYEDLVRDTETEVRRLLAHCGLDWDPACLAHWRNKRAVYTDSSVQVRQPVSDRSVGRWRKYERFLAPLLSELETA